MRMRQLSVLILLLTTLMVFAANCCDKPCTDPKAMFSTPDKFLDTKVSIIGKVDHVCRNTGKKLKIKFDGIKGSIKAMASESMDKFNPEANGKQVKVSGILRKMTVAKEDVKGEEHDGKEHDSGFSITQKDGSVDLYWIECESYELLN